MNDDKIKKGYLKRFCSLIEEGEKMEHSHPIIWNKSLSGKDDSNFFAWITSIESLLDAILPKKAVVRKDLVSLQKDLRAKSLQRDKIHVRAMGLLKSVKKDFESNLFETLEREISNSISMDYLQLAEDVFSDKSCKYYSSHIPAAVLAGVTLERYLRGLCGYAKPPISIVKRNGKHKCMNEMIDDLRRQDVVNETDAKQLRVWAGMRNDAAHGNVENLDQYGVEQMINGVRHFLERSAK